MSQGLPDKSTRFFRLYAVVQPRLYSFLLMVIHNSSDAEELMQETASILWEQFDRYQEGTNFNAWAITIAKIKAFEHLRKNKKALLFQKNTYEEISVQAEATSSDASGHIDALKHCLEKIDKFHSSLLTMRYKRNISIAEMSKITGKSINVLYKTFSRVIGNLRKCIRRTVNEQGMI